MGLPQSLQHQISLSLLFTYDNSYLVITSSAVAQPIPAIMNLSWPLPATLVMTKCNPTKSARSTVDLRNSCKHSYQILLYKQQI